MKNNNLKYSGLMKKLSIICALITSLFISGCCYSVSCAPCLGLPAIFYISSPIFQFDTTFNNYKMSDLDTLFLFDNESSVVLKTPTDTFFNNSNTSCFSGENLSLNKYVSNQSMTSFIKIDSLKYTIIHKGSGCCNCDKYEVSSININDTSYLINQLPILIKKK